MFVNMLHRTHNCTNTLYDYAIIINTYLGLMYELKKIGKVLTSKSVGTGPSSYEKRTYRAAVSQSLRNTALSHHICRSLYQFTDHAHETCLQLLSHTLRMHLCICIVMCKCMSRTLLLQFRIPH